MLTPLVRRSFAPRGKTPILRCWDRRQKVSAISAITISPKRKRLGLYFLLMPDDENVRGPDVVRFLRHLKAHLPRSLEILWDRGNIHERCALVRRYLTKHPQIQTHQFPSYAPELNPDERVWGYTKYGRMANWTAPDLAALRRKLRRELLRLHRRPALLASFLRHSRLPVGPLCSD